MTRPTGSRARRQAVLDDAHEVVRAHGGPLAVGFRLDAVIPGVLADTPAGVIPVGPELESPEEAASVVRSARLAMTG